MVHDLNLEVEEKGVKKLPEMHDRELTFDELKEFSHQQCEETEMKISSKDLEKCKLSLLKPKYVLEKLVKIQNIAMIRKLNKYEVLAIAIKLNKKSIQFFRNNFKCKQKQTTIELFFTSPSVKKLRCKPNCPSGLKTVFMHNLYYIINIQFPAIFYFLLVLSVPLKHFQPDGVERR